MIPIHFNFQSLHTVVKNGGYVSIFPALTQSSRLYVIHNAGKHGRPCYVGTALHTQNRFDDRTKALRDMGVKNAELLNMTVAVVQIQVNGANSPPGNHGISSGIDVEHILIRTYALRDGGVRNMAKANQFQNTSGQQLDCNFAWTGGAGVWGNFFVGNFSINAGAHY